MKFYLPSWYGDFRLEGDNGNCQLVLHDVTEHERVIIGKFLQACKKKKWFTEGVPAPNQPYRGNAKATIAIGGPLAQASKVLIRLSRPKDRTLTAVKFSDGGMEVVEGATEKALEKITTITEKALETENKKDKEKEAKAVSVARPTPCCPTCVEGAIEPATEVLLSFLDAQQHEDWRDKRAIVVTGGFSGHRYVLAHRKSALAAEIGKVCFDLDDEAVVHFHDSAVPPEEEILAAKLILEHRETWLRNEATCFGSVGRAATDVFKNPFGDMMDGTESAGFSISVGETLKAFLRN